MDDGKWERWRVVGCWKSLQPAVGSLQLAVGKVYDIPGREVVTWFDEYKQAEEYKIKFNASKLSHVVYFCL
jgi:hypothetical protein